MLRRLIADVDASDVIIIGALGALGAGLTGWFGIFVALAGVGAVVLAFVALGMVTR